MCVTSENRFNKIKKVRHVCVRLLIIHENGIGLDSLGCIIINKKIDLLNIRERGLILPVY